MVNPLPEIGRRRQESADPGPLEEGVVDYSRLDFESMWKGRDDVTRVEAEIVRILLSESDCRRVLEVGTGFGRLTPTIRAAAAEYVGFDANTAMIEEARRRVEVVKDPRTLWVQGNLWHLPFAAGSFTTVVLVRVAHHLRNLRGALAGLSRVLVAGGTLLISVNPRPSLGTLAQDVKASLSDRRGPPQKWVSFAAGAQTQVRRSPHPVYVSPTWYYRQELEQAGFEIRRVRRSGLEELVPRLPARFYIQASALFASLPLAPTAWFLGDRFGVPPGGLPELGTVLRCPRCLAGLTPTADSGGDGERCRECGYNWRTEKGIYRFLSGAGLASGTETE